MAITAQLDVVGITSPMALPRSPNRASKSLRLLALLRAVTPLGQALTILVAMREFGVRLPLVPVILLLVIETLVATATWRRLRSLRPVSAFELFVQAHVDILALAAMLHLTGGTVNPFAPLLLVPLAIVAASLPPRWIWMTALSTVGCYVALTYFYVPMEHPGGEAVIYDLHLSGMVFTYGITAAMLAFFVARIQSEFQKHQRLLADVKEQQMRNESVVAMGALAAGCAHELSSPLATMKLVITELQRERPGDPRIKESMELVNRQIEIARQVVSGITVTAGKRRAEAAGAAPLDQFLRAIVQRAQALHPGATFQWKIGSGKRAPNIVAEETLRQAITNLVDNAARASPNHVEIAADWSANELVVVVSDRGPGFPQEALDKLGKAAQASSLPNGRLGIGLLLTHVTLDRLGGSLKLSNLPQGGACAEVLLPLGAILLEEAGFAND